MDRPCLNTRWWINLVNRISQNIEHTSKRILTYRNADRSTCSDRIHSTYESVCRSHGDTSDSIITQVLGDFYYQFFSISGRNFDSIVDLRQVAFCEFNIQNGTNNLGNFTYIICHAIISPCLLFFPPKVRRLLLI